MAVKQNNNDANEPAKANAAGNTGSTGSGSGADAKPKTKTASTMCSDDSSVGGVGVATGNMDDNATNASASRGGDLEGASKLPEMQQFYTVVQNLKPEDQRNPEIISKALIHILARKQMPETEAAIKRFRDETLQMGKILALPHMQQLLPFYMNAVYDIMTESEGTPCCAVSIVFDLFSPELIIECVRSLLDSNAPDASLRKTVGLLCQWIIWPFCQNLYLWVMELLKGLRDREKNKLLDQIALDNIEHLSRTLRLPAMRPRAAPIVVYMLRNIYQTPEIFHKVMGFIPKLIKSMHNQAHVDEPIRTLLQQLVDLANALMIRFHEYDDLYAPIKHELQMFEPSPNSLAIAREMTEYGGPIDRRNARVGLVNLGNTCYMNSVLQALAMTSDFSRQILLIESGSQLLHKVQQQIALMHHSMRYELTPSLVLNATRPPGFTPGLQQDSSEFLGYLLDLLHEHEINSGAVENATGKAKNEANEQQLVAAGVIPYNSKDQQLANYMPRSNVTANGPTTPTNAQAKQLPSTIDKTFAGKLSTTYKCLSCTWQSRNEDSFRELQLSFPDDKEECGANNYSVQDLIDYYCSPEQLIGENQYFCPNCKKLCDAERRIGITQPPRNLILTLKQFKYDQKYHFRTKLMHKVFHDESVIVKVCANDSLQENCMVQYDLYAGVVHAGYSMDSGHYFTFAADQSKNWFKFNDSLVTSSEPQEMHSLTSPNTPYILFYQMCGRSSDHAPNATMHPMVPVPVVVPLALEELPRTLRDYVKQDNRDYHDELRLQRFKRNAKRNNANSFSSISRNGYDGDDDDEQSPPPSGCGGNDLGLNCNRFVY
ncbi:CG8830 [Drosophila busckii]|uniref:CG8830 n=1 Tax=Drosophila busckii TaxID=30019 RepID=A0A0M5IZX1_DROBS|nr:ubiquitin carboxyl-terminal hydrolase 38 [Drosophila busckii]ALC41448.1 CG8830 [Drosophila busckii]